MQCEEEKLYKNLRGRQKNMRLKTGAERSTKNISIRKITKTLRAEKDEKTTAKIEKNTKNAGRRAGGRVDTKKYQKIKTNPSERRKKSAPTAAIGSPKNEEITPDNSDQEIN